MKISNYALASFLILSFISNNLFAQSDYLITKINDTIKCQLRKDLLGRLKYRVDTLEGFKKVDFPVKEMFYASDTSTYVWKTIPEKQSIGIVKWLERGRINLFERRVNENGYSFRFWYASENNDSLVQIKTEGQFFATGSSRKERKQALMDMFANNPAVLQSFNRALKKDDYNFDLIRRYIEIYNVTKLPDEKTTD